MAAALEEQARRWTYDDYYRLEDDQRHEVIDGILLFMSPAPSTSHQDWVRELFRILDGQVCGHHLGQVYFAPLDVVLDPENVVQPDLVFVAAERKGVIQDRAVFGVPDLLVEIVSSSSVRRDRYEKQNLYARYGVKEYWIGDPANRTLEILTLKQGHYELHGCAGEKGKLTSLVLPGLEFDLSRLP